jgi:polysaccharide pyruvyl transferase WcaK-like protein
LIPVAGRHPREIMAEAGRCDLMIAMRLHALIFAAAQGVPCIAINYDPKVEALARIVNAPIVQDSSEAELAKLSGPLPPAPDEAKRQELRNKALRNAEVAVALGAKARR